MLTDTQIKKAQPSEKDYKITDGAGLYLLIKPSGGKYWRYKYRFDGKQKVLSIGVYPDVTLLEAREAALNAKKQLKQGIDPSAKKQMSKIENAADGMVFVDLMNTWLDFKSHEWSDEHLATCRERLENNLTTNKGNGGIGSHPIGNRGIKTLKAQDFLRCFEVVEERGAFDLNRRLAQMSSSIMQYGVIKGYLEHNVAWGLKDVLKKPSTTNQKMLPNDDFVTFIKRLKGDNTLSERSRIGLWLILYTLCRTIEVRRMEREEISLDTMTWEVAAEKMKMRRPHRMPLPTQAKPLIERLKIISEDPKYLFPVQRQRRVPRYPYASENLLSDALYSLGFKDKGTVHGLRSNGDSTLNRFKSQFGWSEDIIEAQLAHLPKNAMRKIYNREDYLEERRPMMQWWADYLDSL